MVVPARHRRAKRSQGQEKIKRVRYPRTIDEIGCVPEQPRAQRRRRGLTPAATRA
jgi:hypothetical protein